MTENDFEYKEDFLRNLQYVAQTTNIEILRENEDGKQLEIYPRPDIGIKGQPIELYANWYKLTISKTTKVHFYQIFITENKRLKHGKYQEPGVEINNREMAKIAFWNAVRQLQREGIIKQVDDVVFDYPLAFLPYDLNYGSIYVEHPLERMKKKFIEVKVAFKCWAYFPIDRNHKEAWIRNLSQFFIRALFHQRIRYTPENADIPELEFKKNWHFSSGVAFRLPRNVDYLGEQDQNMRVKLAGLRMWSGLRAAYKSGEVNPDMLNIHLVNSLFVKQDINLIQYYIELQEELQGKKIVQFNTLTPDEKENLALNPDLRAKFQFYIEGLRVFTKKALLFERDQPPKNASRNWKPKNLPRPMLYERNLQIVSIANKPPSSSVLENGYSVSETYKRLGSPLQFPNLPMIVVKQGKKILELPMEVLTVHELPQKFTKLLDFKQTKKYIQKASLPPSTYVPELSRQLEQLQLTQPNAPFLKQYGIQLNNEMTKCEGRVLEPPVFVNPVGEKVQVQPKGTYSILEVYKSASKIHMDVCISITPTLLEQVVTIDEAGQFYTYLVEKLKERKVEFSDQDPQVYKEAQLVPDLENDNYFDPEDRRDFPDTFKSKKNVPTFHAMAKDARQKFLQREGHETMYHVILVFTMRGNDLYGALKRTRNYFKGTLDILIVDKDTVIKALYEATTNNRYTIFYNIPLKINARFGGYNTHLDQPVSMQGKEETDIAHIMFVGIDVTHPGILKGRLHQQNNHMDMSLACIVGSMDVQAAKYKKYVLPQMKVQEELQKFDKQFQKLLWDFNKANQGNFPKHIVVYRDGVSDGEMLKTGYREISWICSAWEYVLDNKGIQKPTITYIVVNKRHNTRFIYKQVCKKTDDVTYINPPPGTVVDQTVVSSKQFDFWMQTHYGALGTAKPIHYTVLFDEWKLSADQIYEMTYHLCFLNARCRKVCSLPVPVYYAHLACSEDREVYRDLVKKYPTEEATIERQEFIEEALNIYDFPGMQFV